MAVKKKGKAKKKPASHRNLVTQAAIARLFGVTVRTVQRWTEMGMPREGDLRGASYDQTKCIAWKMERVREEVEQEMPPVDSIEEARRRKAIADADLAEYDVGERRRELMTTDQYREALLAAYERVGQRLKTLEPRLSPELIGIKTLTQSRKIIRGAVRELMDELYASEDVPEVSEVA